LPLALCQRHLQRVTLLLIIIIYFYVIIFFFLIHSLPLLVTMTNFMRVLGDDAIQDPTRMERKAREEVEKRAKKHVADNEARKLTPEMRKDKLRMKMEKDLEEHGTQVAVFRIRDLSHQPHKFKADKNAQQLHLTGCAILYKNMNTVVVEGASRAVRRYKKLMLHRIKWNNEGGEDNEASDEDESEEDEAHPHDAKPSQSTSTTPAGENECVLVWEGEVKKAAFKAFRFKTCATELLIINFLEKFGVPQYWDFAKNFKLD